MALTRIALVFGKMRYVGKSQIAIKMEYGDESYFVRVHGSILEYQPLTIGVVSHRVHASCTQKPNSSLNLKLPMF
jgi:hypothetical protein